MASRCQACGREMTGAAGFVGRAFGDPRRLARILAGSVHRSDVLARQQSKARAAR